MKSIKINTSVKLRERIKNLNHELKTFHYGKLKTKVWRAILPGNTKSIWDAVKIAKDHNLDSLPKTMYLNSLEVNWESLPNIFASHFDFKLGVQGEEHNI